MRRAADYRTWIFDCDGVLLNSNAIKTRAFFEAARPYGNAAAERLRAYHRKHGGVSRFAKFEHFFSGILARPPEKGEMDRVLDSYGTITREALLSCEAAPGLHRCFARLPRDARKIVVTGGMETEVREIFERRGFASLFDAIYGSPETKESIAARGLEEGTITRPAIFIGDSVLDWEVGRKFGFDFIFLHGWSEVANWESFCRENNIPALPSLLDVLAFLD